MVFVLDKRKKPLMPCTERRARILLSRSRAVVHRLHPFTIRLKDRMVEESVLQPVRLKIDPGSRHSGVALVREDAPDADTVVHIAQLDHKADVQKRMGQRAGYRRRRRSANLRYRKPRFDNRHPEPCAGCGRNARHGSRFCRPCHAGGHKDGGLRSRTRLAPSLRCRVDNTESWVSRFRRWTPVTEISMELPRFDLQAMEDPKIAGAEYQQGTLFGFEVREYLLLKFQHECAYCGGLSGDPVLNIDHIVPRAQHGSDRVSNLALACRTCNEAKNDRTPAEWAESLRGSRQAIERVRVERCGGVQARAKAPLRDAAAVNTTRWVLYSTLVGTGLPVETGSGGRTKWNPTRLGLPKTHALDAACVGESTPGALRGTAVPILVIKAIGRGRYQRTLPDKSGFPRAHLPRLKTWEGFRTGDMVRAVVPELFGNRRLKTAGKHVGAVAIRTSGSFRVGSVDGISSRHCTMLQRADGYAYSTRKGGIDTSSPRLKPGVSGVA